MNNNNANFSPVTEIRDDDGILVAPITSRRDKTDTLRFSFACLRTIRRGEELAQTHWLQKHHIPALRRLLDEVEDFLVREEEKVRVGGSRRAANANGSTARRSTP